MTEHVLTCDSCGATVYHEHLDTGVAGRRGGKLLCRHCLAGFTETAADDPGVVLIDDALKPRVVGGPSARISHNTGISAAEIRREMNYQRGLDPATCPTATRCRTFHAKLTDGSLAHLDEMINEWVDAHDDVHIKFATSSIGIIEGKHADPHLILTMFY